MADNNDNSSNNSNNPTLEFQTFHNVINGAIADTPGRYRRTVNPSTEKDNHDVPFSGPEDVDRAVEAAKKAAGTWSAVSWNERADRLQKFADAIEGIAGELAKLLTMELGKPPMWAGYEIATGIQWIRDFSQMSHPGEDIQDTQERKVTTRYLPLGVVVGIVPWNYPIQLACMKIAPALLTGNCFIWKPSPGSPYTSLKVAELAQRFFPAGVLQALSGDDDLGRWLTGHPGVDMVSFTGSTAVGKLVSQTCSKTLKRCTLELGGNDAAIICADVDPVAVGSKIGLFAFCNSGQICIAMKRVYVHESVYEAVLATVVGFVQSLKLGIEEDAFMGPVANEAQYNRIRALLTDIKTSGLTVAAGSTEPLSDRKGFFLVPTVIDNPPDDSRVVTEEQFGPVIPLLKWSDEQDVIRRANDTDAGLGASVWTRDMVQADRMARQLQAGNVWVNCHAEMQPSTPFSGHKQSGMGVEMGVDGLKSYCNVQSVYVKEA
ncbi:aldehyde dehydrogenase [Xylaria bambusicola]|uniref:aldehyde dehydrogenase n=1 Tax=Xylaria bambusicola TaxID=326684 RepID=UPI0020072638|nr:aldehyde dehydrogenase [Xylaria bambusicola]KAI0505246.1 aldehyde dehydrogenase [Xylaria bambusicola]